MGNGATEFEGQKYSTAVICSMTTLFVHVSLAVAEAQRLVCLSGSSADSTVQNKQKVVLPNGFIIST